MNTPSEITIGVAQATQLKHAAKELDKIAKSIAVRLGSGQIVALEDYNLLKATRVKCIRAEARISEALNS